MDRALRNEPGGVERAELMLNANAVIASAVGHNGRWLSDCHCHSEVKLTRTSYQGRQRMLEKMGLADGLCMWGGRRGVPLALGAIEELVGNVSNADSESYREAMVAASPVHRGIVKKYEVHVKGRYADIMRRKLGLWRQMPCIIRGLLGTFFGYTLEQCKTASQFAIDRWLNGPRSTLHRVSVLLFTCEALMTQLVMFNDNDAPLHCYPRLFCFVLRYGLLTVVGHWLEGRHRRISLFQSGSTTRCSINLLSAILRYPEFQKHLQSPDYVT